MTGSATEISTNENFSFSGTTTRNRKTQDMAKSEMVKRRSLLKAAAVFGGLSTLSVMACAVPGASQESETPAAASPEVRLEDVSAGPNTKLTIQRRGQIVLLGINRPSIRNRIDPETFEKLAKPITNMTTIPRCAPRFYLATGRTFQGGSTLTDFSRLQGRASPGLRARGRATLLQSVLRALQSL
jgi:hypothetical protein